jgi:copper transport protein
VRRRKIFFPTALAVLVAALTAAVPWMASSTQAHGILQRSSPRANAVLSASPGEIVLEFNEAVDPRFSEIRVLGPQGARLARGGEVSPDGRRLRLGLDSAPPAAGSEGAYVVRWRVLSAVDGHTSSGSYVFSVGAQAPVSAEPTPRAPDLPQPVLVLARWLSYLGALWLSGVVLFDAIVLPRAVGRMDPADAVTSEVAISTALGRLRTAAAAFTLAALGFEFSLRRRGRWWEAGPGRLCGAR